MRENGEVERFVQLFAKHQAGIQAYLWTLVANRPIILDAIRIFGVDRCMFASNFPVDGLKGSWDYLYSQFKRSVADFAVTDRRKLFAENAARFYRIAI